MNSASTCRSSLAQWTRDARAVAFDRAPEISSGAWKVIIFLLVGGVLILASLAAYVFSELNRFQDCF